MGIMSLLSKHVGELNEKRFSGDVRAVLHTHPDRLFAETWPFH